MNAGIRRGAPWLFVCGCVVAESPGVQVLTIDASTSSWFEPERLPVEPSNYGCVGVIEDAEGPVVVTATEAGLTLLRAGPDGWSVETVAFEPQRLEDRVLCVAADLDDEPGVEIVVVDGRGGVIVSLASLAGGDPVFTDLPDFPSTWADDPLPLRETRAGALGLFDLDDDGRLDLYVARTQDGAAQLFLEDGCTLNPSGDVHCGVGHEYPGFPDVVLRNTGELAFSLDDRVPSLALQGQCVGAVDLDADGLQELIVCNDAAYNHVLSRVEGVWTDVSVELGLDVLNHGMGVAVGDLDSDGRTDLAFSDIGAPLVLLAGATGYTQAGPERGFASVQQYAWAVAAEDLDNDGDLDLLFDNDIRDGASWEDLICGGSCTSNSPVAPELLLYRNDGHGSFDAERVTPDDANGDAMAVTDIDGDGILDALVIRSGQQQSDRELWLLHGHSTGDRGWLSIAAPFGARVKVCVDSLGCQTREVVSASSIRAIISDSLHFGLGSATSAEVEVEWPHGTTTALGRLESGSRVRFNP